MYCSSIQQALGLIPLLRQSHWFPSALVLKINLQKLQFGLKLLIHHTEHFIAFSFCQSYDFTHFALLLHLLLPLSYASGLLSIQSLFLLGSILPSV